MISCKIWHGVKWFGGGTKCDFGAVMGVDGFDDEEDEEGTRENHYWWKARKMGFPMSYLTSGSVCYFLRYGQ